MLKLYNNIRVMSTKTKGKDNENIKGNFNRCRMQRQNLY